MKRRLSSLSLEYCSSKKLPMLDMPDMGEVTTKSELVLKCIQEQNKNLSLFIEQLKLKEAENLKIIQSQQEIIEKAKKIMLKFKNIYLNYIEKSIPLKNKYNISVNNIIIDDDAAEFTQIENVFINFENYTFEDIQEKINIIDEYILEVLKVIYSEIRHETNGIDDNYNKNGWINGDHLINHLDNIHNDEFICYKQQLIEYKDKNQLLTKKLDETQNELNDVLIYMDTLRHKIYMMHDRYEEKLADLERATNELEKEKLELENKINSHTSGILSAKSEPILDKDCRVTELDKKIEVMSEENIQISSKLNQLQQNFDDVNHKYHDLLTTHKLLLEIPLSVRPEYKVLYERNQALVNDNNQLREYLEFFWNILTEIKSVIKNNAKKFQESISKHIQLMIECINELEVERDNLREQSLQDSIARHHLQQQVNQLNDSINYLTNSNATLKNQNKFYISQYKNQHHSVINDTKVCDIDDDYDKVKEKIDSLSKEEIITKFIQQNKLIKQLQSQQETILSEMEITAQSYEETFDQNIALNDKLKEKQSSNLKLSSDLFKCNQSIQLLTQQLSNIEKLNTNNNSCLFDQSTQLSDRLSQVDNLQKSLENHLNSITFNQYNQKEYDNKINEQLNTIKYTLEMNENQLNKIISENSSLKIELDKSKEIVNHLKTTIEHLNNKILEQNKLIEHNDFHCTNFATTTTRPNDNTINCYTSEDAILNEQIRIYKSKLTCSCCNSNTMNAILSKCFHLFCYSCLQVRYDTRQRKCPKCNTPFGQNDFHKVYY